VRLLVIKHGALGDIVLALPALAAIRVAHPGAHITLLTTKPYAAFLAACPWVDTVETDAKPSPWNLPGLLTLRRQLAGFDMVYDLQTSSRSSTYFRLAGRPRWSGIAKGCAFPDTDPARNHRHTRERLEGQLRDAGIAPLPVPDMSWLTADISHFDLPHSYSVLVPGAAAHRPEKCWPAAGFAALAEALAQPMVIVGGPEQTFAIPGAIDLTGRTTLLELAAVLRGASRVVGNDTGPMHLAAALGIPNLVLFSAASDPALTAPRYPDGAWAAVLRVPSLQNLPVAQVLQALP